MEKGRRTAGTLYFACEPLVQDLTEEQLGPLVLRMAEDTSLGVFDFDDPPSIHEDHPVGDP